MSDTETIQFLVDRLFGGQWPEHSPEWYGWRCHRCGVILSENQGDGCLQWNPLTRIEDAFMVVEAMKARCNGFHLDLTKCEAPWSACFWSYPTGQDEEGEFVGGLQVEESGDTPQAAIVAATVRALEGK